MNTSFLQEYTEAQLGLQNHDHDHILPITKIGNDSELEMRIYTLRSELTGLNLQVKRALHFRCISKNMFERIFNQSL